MKLITIIGARPQFIKAAVVSRAIAEHNELNKGEYIEEKIIHTNQHYDENMSDIFFKEMHIPQTHYNLHVGGGMQGAMTGRMLEKLKQFWLMKSRIMFRYTEIPILLWQAHWQRLNCIYLLCMLRQDCVLLI